jgi:hypothetical protein
MLPNPLSTPADAEPGVIPLTVNVDDQGTFSWDSNLISFDPALDELQVDLTLVSTGTLSWEITDIVFTPQTFQGQNPSQSIAGTSATLTFPKPAHFFAPWTFQLVVSSEAANGVLSPSLYTSLPPDTPDSTSLDLTYDPATGSFTFTVGGFPLASSMILVNTVLPLTVNVTVTGGPDFNSSLPIVWNTGLAPVWAQPGDVDGTTFPLDLLGDMGGNGAFAGFSLVLDLDGVQIASPDPILVNATLGDGGLIVVPPHGRLHRGAASAQGREE